MLTLVNLGKQHEDKGRGMLAQNHSFVKNLRAKIVDDNHT